MKKILFVCTGNTCRSPMAEGICNKIAKDNTLEIIAESAGINAITGLPVSDNSKAVCGEIGVDLSEFTSTWIYDTDPSQYDLFAVMTQNHKNTLMSLGLPEDKIIILNENNGGVTDPYGGNLQIYRECRDEIYKAVKDLVQSGFARP